MGEIGDGVGCGALLLLLLLSELRTVPGREVPEPDAAAAAFARLLGIELPETPRLAAGTSLVFAANGDAFVAQPTNVFRIPAYFRNAATRLSKRISNGLALHQPGDEPPDREGIETIALLKILCAIGALERSEYDTGPAGAAEVALTSSNRNAGVLEQLRPLLQELCPPKIVVQAPTLGSRRASSLTICIMDWFDSDFDRINQQQLDSASRAMLVSIRETSIGIGPTIIPGATCCFACYKKRLLSGFAVASPEAFELCAAPLGADRPSWLMRHLASRIAAELIRLLVGGRPASIGSIIVDDLSSGESTRTSVLIHPTCICRQGK